MRSTMRQITDGFFDMAGWLSAAVVIATPFAGVALLADRLL